MLNAEVSWLDAIKKNEEKYYKKGLIDNLNELLTIDVNQWNTLRQQTEQGLLRHPDADQVLMADGQGGTHWVNTQQAQAYNNHQENIIMHQHALQGMQQQNMGGLTDHFALQQMNVMNQPAGIAHNINGQTYNVITTNDIVTTNFNYTDMVRYVDPQPLMEFAEYEPDIDEPFDDEGDQHD